MRGEVKGEMSKAQEGEESVNEEVELALLSLVKWQVKSFAGGRRLAARCVASSHLLPSPDREKRVARPTCELIPPCPSLDSSLSAAALIPLDASSSSPLRSSPAHCFNVCFVENKETVSLRLEVIQLGAGRKKIGPPKWISPALFG